MKMVVTLYEDLRDGSISVISYPVENWVDTLDEGEVIDAIYQYVSVPRGMISVVQFHMGSSDYASMSIDQMLADPMFEGEEEA